MKNAIFGLMASLVFAGLLISPDLRADGGRQLGPGVMTTIRPFINYSETYQWSPIPTIVAADDSYDWAQSLYFTKSVWCLEFSFKPIRTIKVDFPTEEGTLQTKEVCYMVYSVTNTGDFLESQVDEEASNAIHVMGHDESGKYTAKEYRIKTDNLDGTYKPSMVSYIDAKPDEDGKIPGTVRFVPRFVLVGRGVNDPVVYEKNEDSGLFVSQPIAEENPVYPDQFLPLALVQIAAVEDPAIKFENCVTFPALDIPPGKTVWGIATWVDVDPRIDNLTVYVSGLTNALRWDDPEEGVAADAGPMEGRKIFRKVLELNFFHPGDTKNSDAPYYFGKPGGERYEWVFM